MNSNPGEFVILPKNVGAFLESDGHVVIDRTNPL